MTSFRPLDHERTLVALGSVTDERIRQEEKGRAKRAAGEDWRTCADPEVEDLVRLAVLVEEVGEVSHELTEALARREPPDEVLLRAELVQVAAVAVAWVESIDALTGRRA